MKEGGESIDLSRAKWTCGTIHRREGHHGHIEGEKTDPNTKHPRHGEPEEGR